MTCEPQGGTLNALVSAGQLSLLEDPELRGLGAAALGWTTEEPRRMRNSEPKTNTDQGIPRRRFLEVAAAIGLSTSGWPALAEGVQGLGEEVHRQEDLFVINMLGGIANLNPLVGGGRLGLLDPRSLPARWSLRPDTSLRNGYDPDPRRELAL